MKWRVWLSSVLCAVLVLTLGAFGLSRSSAGSSAVFASATVGTVGDRLSGPRIPESGWETALALPSPLPLFLGMDESLVKNWLREAPIEQVHTSHGGSSLVLRLTFSDGSRAAFKPEQIHPQSVPRKEAAAYLLARKLGLGQVPPTVMRSISRQEILEKLDEESQRTAARILREAVFDSEGRTMGSVMYWVPGLVDVGMDQDAAIVAWTRELSQQGAVSLGKRGFLADLSSMLVFDLIQNNSDRFSGGNILGWRHPDRLFFIDNAFGFQTDSRGHAKARGSLSRCQKFSFRLWVALNVLREEDFAFSDPVFGPLLTDEEIRSLRGRQEHALRYVDGLVKVYGKDAVLAFD